MKEEYLIANLLIGKIYVCESLGRSIGPIPTLSNQFFIFEKKENSMVEEVITGDSFKVYKKNRYPISSIKNNNHIFNKKYVVETSMITQELLDELDIKTHENGMINKWELLKIYNHLNKIYQKQLSK